MIILKVVEYVGGYVRYSYQGFIFKCTKQKFPPKRISVTSCETPLDYWIFKAKRLHGEKYSYEKVSGVKGKHEIACKTCNRVFLQDVSNHLQGNGCPYCADRLRNVNNTGSKELFVSRAKGVHGDSYLYHLVNYKGVDTEVEIQCAKCLNIFFQTPYRHLNGKQPCKVCRVARCGKEKALTTDSFKEKALLMWGDKFSYDDVVYLGSHKKVKIFCNSCKNYIYQTPTNHLSRKGCYECSKKFCVYSRNSYDELCPTGSYIYLLRFTGFDEVFYKVGISKDVRGRVRDFKSVGYDIEVIATYHSKGSHVFDIEKILHQEFKEVRYKPSISFGGHNECFSNINRDDFLKLTMSVG